ncbi:putative reverse transcriptase domain-containing protein [Tanacetum coccineum]
MVNEERGRTMEKDIKDMTINKTLDYPYYIDDAKIDAYYDLPPLLPCFKPIQPYTQHKNESYKAELDEEINYMSDGELVMSEQDLGTCMNIMPNSVFEYLKLTNLKKTDILVRMANMTQQEPLGTVENVLVKIDKFVSPCDFVVIDMPGILGDMMILGKPFLATIRAQIDVFNGEISFRIGEDRVKFDVKGNSHHSNTTFEKVYMATEKESFNPLETKGVLFSYESPTCLQFEQNTRIHTNSDIETIDSPRNIQETSERFDEYKRIFINKVEQLSNEYELKIGKKGYVLDDVWENVNNTMDVQHTYGTIKDMRKNNFGNVELRKPDMPRLWMIQNELITDKITKGAMSIEHEYNLKTRSFSKEDDFKACSLETVMTLHLSTWATKWFKRLVAFSKCNRDSYENFVMSDSEDSTVTYTEVSSPFEDLSDIGSTRVDGPPVMPEDPYAYVVAAFQAPPSPDYIPGPEHPPSPVYVPYVSELVYPEFMPPQDEVLPAEEQPLPAVVSPTADSPGYIPESDPEEDPEEEDLEEDPEEDPADYPADGGDDDDDDESSDDYEDDDDDVEEDEDKEYPHHHSLGFRAAMIWQRAESPSTSHSLPLPPPIILLHTRASVAMMRVAAPSTYILASRSETPPSETSPLLPILAPTSSPPLLLPSTDHRADMPKIKESSSAPAARPIGGFRADYGFVATLDREIRRDPERDIGYRITDTWDEMLKGMPGAPAIDETELGRRMTNFVTTVRQDTDEIYGRLDEAQEARAVLNGRLNLLGRNRRSHDYTALLMEREARLSREAWRRSMEASDTARAGVMSLRTTVLA